MVHERPFRKYNSGFNNAATDFTDYTDFMDDSIPERQKFAKSEAAFVSSLVRMGAPQARGLPL